MISASVAPLPVNTGNQIAVKKAVGGTQVREKGEEEDVEDHVCQCQ